MASAPDDKLEPQESVLDPTEPNNSWRSGPGIPLVGAGIDVWRIRLDLPDQEVNRLARGLSVDELERAERFHFREHRQRFVAAHGALREILGRFLDVPAVSLRFDTSPYGKPSLGGEYALSRLSFNLSHSHKMALLAVGSQRDIGIDIEFVRPDLADEQIARRFFSNLEIETYLALPEDLRQQAFFTCWTRKEAYIKARGEGLSMPLDQFDVTLIPGEPARLINTRPDPAQALQWKLCELNPGPEYCAALAVQGDLQNVNCWNWDASEVESS